MQLDYLLVVVVVSDVGDVKVMSSTVAVIFAITELKTVLFRSSFDND